MILFTFNFQLDDLNTKKILLLSSDKDLSEIIKISALTLTKLNCQVSIGTAFEMNDALEKSKEENLNLIILDHELKNTDTLKLITEIRKNVNSKNKKIIYLYNKSIDKEEVFKAGCDSIMSKEEFKRVVNNILVF